MWLLDRKMKIIFGSIVALVVLSGFFIWQININLQDYFLYELFEETLQFEDFSDKRFEIIIKKINSSKNRSIYRDLALLRFLNLNLSNNADNNFATDSTINNHFLQNMMFYSFASQGFADGRFKQSEENLRKLSDKSNLWKNLMKLMRAELNHFSENEIENTINVKDLPDFLADHLKVLQASQHILQH